MTDLTQTLVVIATYDELQNLPALVKELTHYVPGAEILVVDDNSPDGTGRWCDQRAAQDGRFHVIHRPGKLGLGSATVAGLRYAIEHDFENVLTLDADFSHPPRYIPDLLAALHDSAQPADVVIGSRYVSGGGIQGWPLRRRIMSRCGNWLARSLLGLRVHDCSGAFRCFRVAVLRNVAWDQIRSDGYAFLEELLWLLQSKGVRIREVPITFVDRSHGSSKMTFGEVWSALWLMTQLSLAHGRGHVARKRAV